MVWGRGCCRAAPLPPCQLQQATAHPTPGQGKLQKGEKMLFLRVNIPLQILLCSLFWSLLKQQLLVTRGSVLSRAECKRLIYFLLVLLIHGSPWLLLTTGNQPEAFQIFLMYDSNWETEITLSEIIPETDFFWHFAMETQRKRELHVLVCFSWAIYQPHHLVRACSSAQTSTPPCSGSTWSKRRHEGLPALHGLRAPAALELPPWHFLPRGALMVALGECGGPIGRASGSLPVSPAPEPSPAAGHGVQGQQGSTPSCPAHPAGHSLAPSMRSCRHRPHRDPGQETNDLLRARCLRSTCSGQMKLKY